MHILSSVVPSISPRSSPPAGTGTDETFIEYKHYLVTQVVRKDWFNNFIDNFRDRRSRNSPIISILLPVRTYRSLQQLISYAARKSPVQEFFL